MKRFIKRHDLIAYLFLLPWLVGILVFVCIPLISSIHFSTSKVRVTLQGLVLTANGIENFKTALSDTWFTENIVNFAVKTALSLPVIIVFSMMVAIMLNTKMRGKGIFRVLFFLPVVISSGPVMSEFTNQKIATVPMLQEMGLENILMNLLPRYLAQPISSVFSQIILILWFSGVQILIFLAGLQKVDAYIYEAASIDGASAWEGFWKITLPSLKNITFVTTIYTLIALATFDNNDIVGYIRNKMFDSINGGYGIACAMAWIYAAVILLLLLICALVFIDKHSEETELKRFKKLERQRRRLYRKQRRKEQVHG
ncbi:MAG: transporter periplasmic subunit [Herbinix sp.]|jgi:ABC-type sugar transport system permease subunit|nr:transporter periplasmic subunit [Herbinix sp.]